MGCAPSRKQSTKVAIIKSETELKDLEQELMKLNKTADIQGEIEYDIKHEGYDFNKWRTQLQGVGCNNADIETIFFLYEAKCYTDDELKDIRKIREDKKKDLERRIKELKRNIGVDTGNDNGKDIDGRIDRLELSISSVKMKVDAMFVAFERYTSNHNHGSNKNGADTSDIGISYDEIRSNLERCGWSDMKIEMFFAKYDVDGNKALTKQDLEEMIADLELWIREDKTEKGKRTRDLMVRIRSETDAKNQDIYRPEFAVISRRVDRVEHSIGRIVDKMDAMIVILDRMETSQENRKKDE